MATPKFNLRELTPGGGQPHLTLNEALRVVDFMLQRVVHSFAAFSQPNFDVEVFGRTHIINGTPDNEWAGKPYWIASYGVGRWFYVEPKVGMMLWYPGGQSPLLYVGPGPSDGPWAFLLP